MLKKSKARSTKILACVLSLIMLMTIIPLGVLVPAFAATMDSYTIALTDGDQTVALNDVQITMTNKANPEETMSQNTKDGVSVFSSFVEENETYIVSVQEIVGYKIVEDFEITPTADVTNWNVSLTALEKITIRGKVVDENGNNYPNAKVSISGYFDAETVTNDLGEYTFEAYEGETYKITATAQEEKYESQSTTVTNPTSDYACETLQFALKQFAITTASGANGTVTESKTVVYGSSVQIEAIADAGYCIESFIVDGEPQSIDVGVKSFSHLFENINQKHNVEVTFVRNTYTLTFTVSENGNVTYNDGAETIPAGSVEVVKSFDESTDPSNPTTVTVTATPEKNYRVAEVTINDEQPQTFSENNREYSHKFEMDQNYTFAVTFAPNQFNVTATIADDNANSKGSVELIGCNDGKVDYGSEFSLKITTYDGWKIQEVKNQNGDLFNCTYSNREDAYIVGPLAINGDTDFTITYAENNELHSFNENITVELKNGNTTVTFNDGKGEEITSLNDLTPKNTSGLVCRVDGNTIVLKAKTVLTFKNRNNNGNIEGQFVYSEFDDNIIYKPNANGWYNPKSQSISLSESCKLVNLQVHPGEKNTINPQDNLPAAEQTKQYTIIMDNTAPFVSVSSAIEGWTNANKVEITGSVSDPNEEKNPSSGASYVVWSTGKLTADEVLANTENKVQLNEDGTFAFESLTGEQNAAYYIYAVDVAGNVSDAGTISVQIDQTKPSVTAVTKRPDTDWTNQEVTVFVTASDDNVDHPDYISGIDRVVYTKDSSLSDEQILSLGAAHKATLIQEGKYEFTVSGDQESTYYIYAIDNAGNISEVQSSEVKITTSRPKIDEIEKSPENEWSNKDVVVTVSASSQIPGVQIDRVVYTTDSSLSNEQILALDAMATLNPNGQYEFTVTGDQKSTYYIYAVDEAGNVSEAKTISVNIDIIQPTVEEFTFETPTTIGKVIHFLSFGLFGNESIVVTATVADDASGCKSVTFELDSDSANDTIWQDVSVEGSNNAQAQATIPLGFKGVVKAVVYDNAGNASDCAMATSENSNLTDSSLIMLENAAPEITFYETSPAANSNGWYNRKDLTIPFAVSDETNETNVNSGLYSIEVNAYYNNNEKPFKTVEFNEGLGYDEKAKEQVFSKDITLTLGTDIASVIPYQGDGAYNLQVIVTDNCGNVTQSEKMFYIDTTAARIVNFDFDKKNSECEGAVEETAYGYYFKEDVDVAVLVDDTVENINDVSGVSEVWYYTVDYSDPTAPITSEDMEAEYRSEDNQPYIPIHGSFKGQIYAWVIDKAGNSSLLTYDGEALAPVKPDGSIVEPGNLHETETHIAFSKPEATNYTQDGSELYAEDVPVTLTVTDTYSGIRSIAWEVVAPYDQGNNQKGQLTVKNDATLEAGSDTGWNIVKTDSNLVTEMTKTILVSNDSNNIVVKVKMTDRAGNVTEQEIEFSIDKTLPVIEVTYDNNTPDATYTNIYKANRTATVKVFERNFNAEDVVYKITNTDGVIPKLSAWTEHKNAESPDETYYTATILYSADGDYTFDIRSTDLAGNTSLPFEQHQFTVDKTLPVLSVTYDNNSAMNGNYYKANRTATITIREHNFDPARVQVLGTATDNGARVAFPSISSWNNNGDVHTATLSYVADAMYTFDVAFLDKAGNSIADYTPETFFVDKTAPTLEITGVADKSANKGEVAPIVTCTDTNFNKEAVSIELTGVNNGPVNYAGTYSDIANGQMFAYQNFETVQKVDDIYTLLVKLTDMAGNETQKSITFSANRFGSVYDLSKVQNMIGKYLQNESDVVFTEINVDSLNRESVKLKLVKNGTPVDLVEGKDYTISVSGGNGQWSRYEYVVNKALFASDGNYRLTVYSVDAAGNINENIDETKKAEISFGIDKTAPVIVPVDFESGAQYPVEVKVVSVDIKDNLVLEGVKIYLNGQEIEYTVEGETYTFSIPASNSLQDVKIVAVDAAGNENPLEIEDFLVSTNIFVRWYNNTPLFIGSIIGVVVLAVAIIAFLVFGKKKKKDKDKDE